MKNIIVGISGGIAAFKTCQLVSDLSKQYNVRVIMSKNATEFINPLTFETLCAQKCLVDTFDRNFEYNVEHVALAKWADVFILAPATANVIAKIAHGICDDMLTTTFLASKAIKIIAPAMNTNMYENPITKANIELLKQYGMHIMDAPSGYLACKDYGSGKMIDIKIIEDALEIYLEVNKPLLNQKVLISAGPTQEALDPIRYITNHSSGKMGYALARAARNLGAEVVLVSGPCALEPPYGIKVVNVISANDMYNAIMSESDTSSYIIMSSAVADYTPLSVSEHKIKKNADDLSIPLKRTADILATLGEHKKATQVLCGFAMESEHLIENAQAKLHKKKADLIVANNINVAGAGFKHDTNVASFISVDGVINNELCSKKALAFAILEKLIEIGKEKGI